MYLCNEIMWKRYRERDSLAKRECSHPPQVKVHVGWGTTSPNCYALYLEVVGASKHENVISENVPQHRKNKVFVQPLLLTSLLEKKVLTTSMPFECGVEL